MSNRINELAIPKGNVSAKCEICGNKATTKCESCRVTHYCSAEHKSMDAISFHKKVCKELARIRTERPLPSTETDRTLERDNILQSQRDVLRQAQTVTRRWLLERKPLNAYPPAMITWNMANALKSLDDTELIVPACLVSEMFLNSGDLKASQEYMVQASWISQKFDTIPAGISYQLYRLRGLVLMATGNWELAREAFAECVYAVAFHHGISDIRMGVPLGLLGLSLLKFDIVDGAMACFHRMAYHWLEYLLSRFADKNMRIATEAEMAADEATEEMEFQFMELKTLLAWVYEVVRKLGMNESTDLINFKILCLQVLVNTRENNAREATVFVEEAIATATRTKMDTCVLNDKLVLLKEVLGDDFILRWEKKHNRPRTIATKYLEMIKALEL